MVQEAASSLRIRAQLQLEHTAGTSEGLPGHATYYSADYCAKNCLIHKTIDPAVAESFISIHSALLTNSPSKDGLLFLTFLWNMTLIVLPAASLDV